MLTPTGITSSLAGETCSGKDTLAFSNSGIPHNLEMSCLGDLKRDADLLPPMDGGISLAIDVAVCQPAPLFLFPLAPEASARIVQDRTTRKDLKYGARFTTSGSRFEPFVLATWGS